MAIDPSMLENDVELTDIDIERDTPDFEAVTQFENDLGQRRDNRVWYIIVQESCHRFNRGDRISGQFTPQQVTENIGGNVVEAGGYSRQSPIIQWVGGKIDSWSFQARFFSEYTGDDSAAEKYQLLKYLTDRDTELGRPPIVAFFWGSVIPDGLTCFIEDISSSYDEIRDDGSIRGLTASITIKKFTEFHVEVTTLPQTERTPTHEVRHGETYEMIAQQRYGDPLLGVLLRQLNPRFPMTDKAPKGVADLEPGEMVKLFPVTDLYRERIQPQCHILRRDNFAASDNRTHFFNLRSSKVAVMPKR